MKENVECFVYRKFFWSEVGRIADKSAFKRFIFTLMSKVPERTLKNSFNRFIKWSDRRKTEWVRILTFPTPNKEYGYLRKWYENSADIEFENVVFPGIEDYKAYLSFKFGNYMELPPEEQRKVHPVSDIKL